MKRFPLVVFLTISFATLAFLVWCSFELSRGTIDKITQEHTWIESTQPPLYFMAMTLGLLAAFIFKSRLWAIYSFLMLVAAARELSYHKAFTQDSILKINFYKNPNVPFIEKTGGIIFILLLVFCVAYLVQSLWKNRHRLRLSNTPVVFSFAGFISLCIAKTLDGFGRKFDFPPFDAIYAAYSPLFALTEETLETTAPLFFLCAVIFAILRKID